MYIHVCTHIYVYIYICVYSEALTLWWVLYRSSTCQDICVEKPLSSGEARLTGLRLSLVCKKSQVSYLPLCQDRGPKELKQEGPQTPSMSYLGTCLPSGVSP